MHMYALYTTLDTKFIDISWPLLEEGLGLERTPSATISDDYLTPADHSCDGTADLLDDLKQVDPALVQTNAKDSKSDSSIKASAYRTSIALLDVAKTTHAVLDSHTHNSSV